MTLSININWRNVIYMIVLFKLLINCQIN